MSVNVHFVSSEVVDPAAVQRSQMAVRRSYS